MDRQAGSLVGVSVLKILIYLSTHQYVAAENLAQVDRRAVLRGQPEGQGKSGGLGELREAGGGKGVTRREEGVIPGVGLLC